MANRYILVISTADHYPSMVKEFDTYFLESDSITGPWSYVTYMEKFGPEAYFVHFPSKFAATSVQPAGAGGGGGGGSTGGTTTTTTATGGFYNAFLSYSANFAFGGIPEPLGSGYHLSLQQSRFALSSSFVARLTSQTE